MTDIINLHSVFLRKTHCIGIEFFGKMKISKIKEQCTEIIIFWRKQKHEAHLFIIIFMLLSNSGFNVKIDSLKKFQFPDVFYVFNLIIPEPRIDRWLLLSRSDLEIWKNFINRNWSKTSNPLILGHYTYQFRGVKVSKQDRSFS